MTEHTKLPWRWDGGALLGPGDAGAGFDDCILRTLGNCGPEPEDEEFIELACNSHDEMVEALEKAKRELDADLECLFCYSPKDSHVDDCPAPLIEAALAKAKKAP